MHCEKLKSIVLPITVTSISDETFACCYSLESIDLSNVQAIGKYAFAECDALKEMTIGDGIKEIDASSFKDAGYCKLHANWENGLLYLDKWVIGCSGSTGEYLIRSDTVGIAADVFANEWHIKRTKNPKYHDLEEQFQFSMVCPQVPIPDFSDVPEYLEEVIPAQIRYEGTLEDWSKIVKLSGDKRIPAHISAEDGTKETYL